ncbi:MAG: SIS domain-containing protein [Woeseia sp.]
MNEKIDEHLETIQAIRHLVPQLELLGLCMSDCLSNGGKILWMGNGGSAADSQHLAAELIGRFARERPGLASIALTTDTSVLTAVGNDYGYEKIFARQIEALCKPGDVVVGISTSGNSANVLAGIRAAKARDAQTIGFTGRDGGALDDVADDCLIVPSYDTARIQEAHILMGHLLCDWVEDAIVNA